MGIALAVVLMFRFDLFWDTSYPNVIFCSMVLLPSSHPAVFSLCAVNKRSIGINGIISIKIIKYQVSVAKSCILTTSTGTGVKEDICYFGVNGY